MANFADYRFTDFLNKALTKINFQKPTPVQEKVIPLVQTGRDLIVQAQTGSGKTHAYLLPLLDELTDAQQVQLVITAPSRELAYQIRNDTEQLLANQPSTLRVGLYVGGTDKQKQVNSLKNKQPQIVIGTPGRVWDLVRSHDLLVYQTKYFVIDEADMTLDLGFLKDVDLIAGSMPEKLQTMVFSATIPPKLQPFLKKYLHNPKVEKLAVPTVIAPNIDNWSLFTRGRDRKQVLKQVLTIGQPYLALVFANTKKTVDEVYDYLVQQGLNVAKIHGDLKPRERRRIMKAIENMEFQYVVASDLAARGIDIPGVSHVVNYQLPSDDEFFIHRVGRTGRNQLGGTAITLYGPDEEEQIHHLENLGIVFQPKEIKNGEFVDTYERDRRQKRSATNKQLDNKLVGLVKKQKQKKKPGYRKKIKQAISDDRRQQRKLEHRQQQRQQRKIKKQNHLK
ncbi:DEAD/DEAH box helicase [Bombilactobacillus thymidiniphilus]|uniref:DEAD-box ATP-dependent RNA helicase CshB n=1 Tax=Bombilactobacillus thymidiniphilus TaxID=2923363 RepID=A0ABY4PDT4_9LACO|nr:DEAD/DEAH box helicase [Bombilactobacillus thymidiniphilus]UQS83900.1 DEAD/DEAH box helicase [Bombilactobacillus thymidiniphilus]